MHEEATRNRVLEDLTMH